MTDSFDNALQSRLVRYAAIDSQSDENSPTAPSTKIQFDMLHLVRDELTDIGAQDVQLTDYGVVLATIPARRRPPQWASSPMSTLPRSSMPPV